MLALDVGIEESLLGETVCDCFVREMNNMTMYRDDHGDLHTWDEIEDMFVDMIDEAYEEVKLGELSWYPSTILQRMDPIAYRCYLSDYSAEFEEVDDEDVEED